MSFELMAVNGNISQLRMDNHIKLVSAMDLSTKLSGIRELVKTQRFFRELVNQNSEIIQCSKIQENEVHLFVKNPIDEDDEELQGISFTVSSDIHNSQEICIHGTPTNSDKVVTELGLEDMCERLSFDDFKILINPKGAELTITYSKEKHPSYIGAAIGKYFSMILGNFMDYVQRSL